MACKKSELISAINSYAAARVSGDQNLMQMSAELLSQGLDTLEFAPEEEATETEAVTPEVVE
jgi:hypothetical protein